MIPVLVFKTHPSITISPLKTGSSHKMHQVIILSLSSSFVQTDKIQNKSSIHAAKGSPIQEEKKKKNRT